MTESSASRVGLAAALAATFFFGVNTIAAKLAADAGAPGAFVVLCRTFALFVLLALVLPVLRWSVAIAPPSRPAMAAMMATSAGMGICYMSSVTYIPVTVAAVIFYTYPALIVLGGPLVTGRPLERRELVVSFVAFAGIVLVVGPTFGSLDPRGLAFALSASAFTAAQFFAAGRIAHESVVAKLFWVQVGVLPVAAIVAYASLDLSPATVLAAAPGAMTMTIGCYVAGSIGMLIALSRLRPAAAALVFCLEPVISAAASAAWLGERMTAVQYAGGALVIAAVAATALAPLRQPKFA
ncbi:MAG: hypothetical protein BGP06_20425 [Rhizobiales bacterium 65-9]|nr:EamA family transporter [Hyphomicrobiales bacterium]OJY36409.1 MAG: hypothetical protein BGP06_20425 [Rhizobiales bacterium 65-9]